MKILSSERGFTIVELIVVIVVIGIISTIIFFTLGGWRAETAKTEVKNDLQNVVSEIEAYRTWKNVYPANFSALDYEPTDSVDIQYHLRTGAASYCINGSSNVEPSVKYNVDTRAGEHMVEGTCTAL